ncbi:hypothetical protein HMPREF1137_0843 [Actinomyces sp. ICM39]|nr:hypothetical protein HMPREF1137_0843 [Actinomyces sp. ICM39]
MGWGPTAASMTAGTPVTSPYKHSATPAMPAMTRMPWRVDGSST